MNHFQRKSAVLGEQVKGFDRSQPGTSEQGQAGIAECGQRLGPVASPGPGGVLAEGDVPMAVQIILDGPMASRQRQQIGGPGTAARQAGDGVNDLDRGLALDRALARDPAELRRARPVEIFRPHAKLHRLKPAQLDTAVPGAVAPALSDSQARLEQRPKWCRGGIRGRWPPRCRAGACPGCP